MTNLRKIFRTYLLLGLLILSALFPTGCGAFAERPPIAAELEDVPAYVRQGDFEVLVVLGAGDLDNYVPEIEKILSDKYK